jgi:putative flavoprotein involved in K+ transport
MEMGYMKEEKMNMQYDTIVIGGGQAGLSVGYYLSRLGQRFLILEANQRIGDTWRKRWDSLRLFTPARFNGLAGMPFPARRHYFPTKDEMADFLEGYAKRFELPVLTGTRVKRLYMEGERYIVQTEDRVYEAANVVVAMANYQVPWKPAFASQIDAGTTQLHSGEYRSPYQLQAGKVLIVGAGNSGSEIAMELAPRHQVYMSGRSTGEIPFRIDGFLGRHLLVKLVLRLLFHRVLTVDTPIGRKIRPKVISKGGPLIRVKQSDMEEAGIERLPKMTGVKDGLPVLEDGRVLEVENIVWCTGFRPGFSWIDLPIHGDYEPQHERGVVLSQPGLYFTGLHFQSGLSSSMIHGVSKDARYIVNQIARRARSTQRTAALAESRAART